MGRAHPFDPAVMTELAAPLFLVRLSPELTTKARRTRRRFQEKLARNLQDALACLGGQSSVRNKWDRFLIESDHPGAAERIAGVFGISSVSRVEARVPPDREQIVHIENPAPVVERDVDLLIHLEHTLDQLPSPRA